MPSIQSLTMTYDALNDDDTFSEGDTLTGKVTLALLKETTVESLVVKAKGDADVHWTKKSGDNTHTYHAHKRYFKLKQCLIKADAQDTVVPKGIHIYKFSINIPPGSLPSSFKGTHGKIVYKLEAKLSRSWRMDRTVEKDIRFVSKSYPNLHALMLPQGASTKKEMGFFSKGHVDMDVTVDKSAYAQGETMAILAKIKNSSSSEMTPKFSLIQEVVYRANSNTKRETSFIHKVVDHCIKSRTQKDVRFAIQIPRVQMPSIQNCDIISVEYHFKAYLDISFAFDPEIIFPVVIIPADLDSGRQPAVSGGPYPAGAAGGQSNSDFPASVAFMGSYPVSPRSGSYRYPGAQRYSAPPPAYPDNPLVYAAPPAVSPAQPANMSRGFNNPVPQLDSPYGSPFLSSFSVIHPPPTAPTFQPHPSAPSPFPPPFSVSQRAPAYNLLPSAPMMNTDFLSQSDEAPPAYSLLFPSSATDTSNAK